MSKEMTLTEALTKIAELETTLTEQTQKTAENEARAAELQTNFEKLVELNKRLQLAVGTPLDADPVAPTPPTDELTPIEKQNALVDGAKSSLLKKLGVKEND